MVAFETDSGYPHTGDARIKNNKYIKERIVETSIGQWLDRGGGHQCIQIAIPPKNMQMQKSVCRFLCSPEASLFLKRDFLMGLGPHYAQSQDVGSMVYGIRLPCVNSRIWGSQEIISHIGKRDLGLRNNDSISIDSNLVF